MNKSFQFYVERNLMKHGIAIYARKPSTNGGVFYAAPLTFNKVEEGDEVSELMLVDKESATQLMNELWNAGIRPNDIGSPGELAAIKAHLKDMRDIVFDLMKLQK